MPRLFGASVILDIHDILPEFYASKFRTPETSLLFKLLVLTERCSAWFSDHVIVANHLWHERLVRRSVSPEKCTAVCNYPNAAVFKPRPRTRPDGPFVIVYPGSLNWHQGLDVAIRAFAKVVDHLPEAEFWIFGEGPAKPELVELAARLSLTGKVIFHDMVPIERIAEEMANADLAVVPKRASSPFGNEAASTKILEFMSVGIPVIVSRTRIDTYYHTSDRVKFFESEDETDLADAILELERQPELRRSLAKNAEVYARQNNWAAKRHIYLNLVDSLVSSKRKRHEGEGSRPVANTTGESLKVVR